MNWQRLADEVIRRRVHLGYATREQFTEATGFAARTLGDLEKNRRQNFDRVTIAKLEQALQWPPGRVAEILGAPEPRSSLFDGLTPLPREIAYLVHVYNELPDEERPDFLRFVEMLAEMGAAKAAKARQQPAG